MIEARHRAPPQHLWRWDGPYVWVGRWRIAFDSVLGGKIAMTREELQEAAKIIWMLGFNAKTMEVQELMTKAAAEFSHFRYLLPPEIGVVAKKKPPAYWLLLWFAIAMLTAPTGILIASAVVRGFQQ